MTAPTAPPPRRRRHLTHQGEPLLLADEAFPLAARFNAFVNDSGLSPDDVLSDPVVRIPLPLYPEGGFGPRRRWAGTRPEMMWHPLMWLPSTLTERVRLPQPGEEPWVEPDEVWALRVCLVMAASGLYDQEDGWVDVLDQYGLDVDTPADAARVNSWLAGEADPVLDDIDLGPYLDLAQDQTGDPQWAISSSLALIVDMEPASWATVADNLYDEISSARDGGTDLPRQALAVVAQRAAMLADSLLVGVPASADESADRADEAFAVLLDRLEQAEAQGPASWDAVEAAVGDLEARLDSIRSLYWPHVENLEVLIAGSGAGAESGQAETAPSASAGAELEWAIDDVPGTRRGSPTGPTEPDPSYSDEDVDYADDGDAPADGGFGDWGTGPKRPGTRAPRDDR